MLFSTFCIKWWWPWFLGLTKTKSRHWLYFIIFFDNQLYGSRLIISASFYVAIISQIHHTLVFIFMSTKRHLLFLRSCFNLTSHTASHCSSFLLFIYRDLPCTNTFYCCRNLNGTSTNKLPLRRTSFVKVTILDFNGLHLTLTLFLSLWFFSFCLAFLPSSAYFLNIIHLLGSALKLFLCVFFFFPLPPMFFHPYGGGSFIFFQHLKTSFRSVISLEIFVFHFSKCFVFYVYLGYFEIIL